MTETCSVPHCDRPAKVLAPPLKKGSEPRPMCARHYAGELYTERTFGPRGVCRAPKCEERAYGPDFLCHHHREQARRLGLPYDAPAELFAPRKVRASTVVRPNDEVVTLRVSAYAWHILWLVGKQAGRSVEEQARIVLEEWAGRNRPREI